MVYYGGMYIKLTRFDNTPIWINGSFVVTVEPRRQGSGAVVVPIGDGLDYDVRESPEEVLKLLEGAPAAAVVPVPVSDCLTTTPKDVSPEAEPARDEPPAKETPSEPPKAETKPKKRAPRRKAKAPAESTSKAAEPAPVKPEEKPAEPPKLDLSGDEVVRLRKLAPKSLNKLKNTLATQFHVENPGATVMALASAGVLTVDGTRIVWTAEPSA